MSDAVTIPNVEVSLSIKEEGEPHIIIMFNRLPDRAQLFTSVRGMDREQLIATLRVIATSVEESAPYESEKS